MGLTPAESAALRIKTLEEEGRRTHTALICALNQLLDLRDLSTGVHSTRLAEWAVQVAEDFGMDESYLHDVEVAALLHDIGKIGIPDAVLHKQGPFTREEREQMKKHPEYGWAILRLFPGLERASLFVLHHHERIDGNGYPGGLCGKEIPFGARIVAVVDAFDAMISTRSYRQRLPLEETLRRLKAASGTQFDPEIVQYFSRLAVHELPQVSQIAEPSSSALSLSG